MIRWDVIQGNLPLIGAKLLEHLALTLVAVVGGLAISGLAVMLIRDRPRIVALVTGFFSVVYTIPSLALLAFLVPLTHLTFLTAEIALVGYTLFILTRNLLAGLASVPRHAPEAA